MVALKGDKEIGDKMNKIIAKLAEANDLKGVIDVADFNDADKLGKGKEMVDRLSNLVAIFAKPELDFSGNRAEGDDLLGDAYEYLMRHFATESGKSKGQFYTPAEVSRIMAKVIGVGGARSAAQTIHDPTCGSGSLLLKAHDEAKGRTGLDLALYGQEMDNATKALARMNMILHDCPTAEIWQDNSLSSPHFKGGDGPPEDVRLRGRQSAVLDQGVEQRLQSRRGRVPPLRLRHPAREERRLRVPAAHPRLPEEHGQRRASSCRTASSSAAGPRRPSAARSSGGAPSRASSACRPNLFYGTGIPACIIVLDKDHAHARKGIFMVDASKGFLKDGNKNRLRAQDIHRIVDTFTRQLEVPRYARMVPLAEISDPKNDFNLNLPRYIDSTEPEDLQDIDAHLRGGIPDRDIDGLDRYWQVFPAVRATLFAPADRDGYTTPRRPRGRGQGRHLRSRRIHRLQRPRDRAVRANGERRTRRDSRPSSPVTIPRP